MKIADSAIEEIIGIFLNYFALFAFFAANRNNKGVVQLRCLCLACPSDIAIAHLTFQFTKAKFLKIPPCGLLPYYDKINGIKPS